jgi:protein-tyrosine phosphatase
MSYVDLHCHLLPGLDDGAPTLAETLRYARRLDAEGVRDVACTPHVKRAHFPAIDLRELAALRARVQRALDAEGLRVRLHPGGELAHEDALELDEDELELIAQGPEGARWLLLECPFRGLGDDFDEAVERLSGLGYGLLLAHPERMFGSLERLWPHVEAGALLQINVSSLLGDHGPRAQETAGALVRGGRAYCLASDTHPGTRERTLPLAGGVLRRLGVSDVQALRLTQSNPRFLLREGDPRLDTREQVMVGPKSCGRGTGGPGSSGDRRRAEPQPRAAGTD